MSYSYDAGSATPGYAGLIECNGLRINSASPSGSTAGGGTFKMTDNPLLGTAPMRLPMSDLPSDHGAATGTPLLSGWPLNFGGWLYVPSGPDDVPAAQEQLKAAFSALNGPMLVTANARGWTSKRQITAQLNGQITFTPRHGRLLVPTRDFTIPMLATDPLMYNADTLQTVTISTGGSGTLTTLTNNGNAPTPFVVKFTGPWTNPVLVRNADSASIGFNTSPTSGHYYQVSTNAAQAGGRWATDDLGNNVYGGILVFTLNTIPPGTSQWWVGGTPSGGATCTMTFRDAWG